MNIKITIHLIVQGTNVRPVYVHARLTDIHPMPDWGCLTAAPFRWISLQARICGPGRRPEGVRGMCPRKAGGTSRHL